MKKLWLAAILLLAVPPARAPIDAQGTRPKLVVFIVVSGLMTPIPAAYLNDVRHAIGMPTYDDTRRSVQPPPPASDQELARILDSRRPVIGAVIGLAGIAILAYLMMFKPF